MIKAFEKVAAFTKMANALDKLNILLSNLQSSIETGSNPENLKEELIALVLVVRRDIYDSMDQYNWISIGPIRIDSISPENITIQTALNEINKKLFNIASYYNGEIEQVVRNILDKGDIYYEMENLAGINNYSAEVIEEKIPNKDISNNNAFTEDFLLESYIEEDQFFQNHSKESFPEFIEEDNFERNYIEEENPDTYSSSPLDALEEHISINELFYKFCYSSEIFNLYLIERESRETLSKEVYSEIEWPTDEDSITSSYFREFLQDKGLYLMDFDDFPSSFFYNDVFFEFKTRYHFFENNKLLEKFLIEGDYIDDIEHLDFPVVKGFIVFIKNNIPHSIFNILYEPIIMKYSLNRIHKSGAAKIISFGDSVDELIEILEDRCDNDENDILFQ